MSLGPAPLVDGPDGEEEGEDITETTTRPAVLADGTYATQAAYSTSAAISQVPNLREMLLKGDSFLSAVIASTLTKLALRVLGSSSVPQAQKNATQAECMLYIVSMLRLGIERQSADRNG